jgi:hypothetical protein
MTTMTRVAAAIDTASSLLLRCWAADQYDLKTEITVEGPADLDMVV